MKGLIHVYTGDGKGKTTAALGLALRASGWGRKILIVQFFKSRDAGELRTFAAMPDITVLRLEKDYGFFNTMSDGDKLEVREKHDLLLNRAIGLALAGECDMLILDEATSAYNRGAVDCERLEYLLLHKPEALELVLTGRDAPMLFLEQADYVTEMRKLKHPFDIGIHARGGIEY